ncbi:MAG: glycerophosphodiester phosphodiesterase [Novosphingobium sp.]|uniref:glycerophosphodiester phosphodiesterase family protein n=1 Tax=Novosphingobium sp. NDB2Meth1 TaxID=1892847 RepID=UPI0009301252|nr:glycerophosphodiester phosphodiesterase family protein [Novosphingobium sp. NDB2Meth1]MBY0393414.1 glycerophosphodiester phosphodiesterase [Novosphingobium sp.]
MLYLLSILLDRLLAPPPQAEKVAWLKGVTYAHRGLHGPGLPENALSAFAAAIEAGYGIECDVQRSSDGQAMVFHDWELDRLTAETGLVIERSAAKLSQIKLIGNDEDLIPSLRDLLDLVAGRVPLLIEVKTRPSTRIPAICLAVRRMLEGYRGPVAVMSFDPRVSRWFARHSSHIVRGLVMMEEGSRTLFARTRRHIALWQAKPDFLAYDITDMPSRFAGSQRKRGFPVLTWTVNTPDLMDRALKHGDGPIAEGAGITRAARS